MISVIIPVYNLEKDIGRCLGSIIEQTYSELEIIVVDDGSSDSSPDIIKKYAQADSRIKVFSKANGGVTDARLLGIKESTGDWIGFVDGDDEIEPGMFELLLNNAIKYNADISHCGFQMRFADGRIKYFNNTKKILEQNRVEGLVSLLEGVEIEPSLGTKLFKRELFIDLEKKMSREIRINEDLLMNYYLFSKANRSVFEDVCPYHYIVRNTSSSHVAPSTRKIFDPIRVKQIILDDIENDLKECAKHALIRTYIYTYCALINIKGSEASHYRKTIRSELKKRYIWCENMTKKNKLQVYFIIKQPRTLKWLYPMYVKYVQKSKYS